MAKRRSGVYRRDKVIVPRGEWPEDLRHPEVRGIAVGGCVAGDQLGRHTAHAHIHKHRGWICFRNVVALADRATRLHELAHVVTREGHTRRWREFLLQIGGSLDPVPGISRDYHARARAGRRIVETAVRPDGSVHVTYGNGSVTSYPPGSPGALRRAAAKREGEG